MSCNRYFKLPIATGNTPAGGNGGNGGTLITTPTPTPSMADAEVYALQTLQGVPVWMDGSGERVTDAAIISQLEAAMDDPANEVHQNLYDAQFIPEEPAKVLGVFEELDSNHEPTGVLVKAVQPSDATEPPVYTTLIPTVGAYDLAAKSADGFSLANDAEADSEIREMRGCDNGVSVLRESLIVNGDLANPKAVVITDLATGNPHMPSADIVWGEFCVPSAEFSAPKAYCATVVPADGITPSTPRITVFESVLFDAKTGVVSAVKLSDATGTEYTEGTATGELVVERGCC